MSDAERPAEEDPAVEGDTTSEEEEQAAVKIQAVYRGRLGRRDAGARLIVEGDADIAAAKSLDEETHAVREAHGRRDEKGTWPEPLYTTPPGGWTLGLGDDIASHAVSEKRLNVFTCTWNMHAKVSCCVDVLSCPVLVPCARTRAET
jgi:hypothetical protein